jgi:hypothetical protein
MKECLQLLIQDLRHLQHELDSALRTEQFILNKLITACQDVPACQYACFRPSDTLAELINDLRSSIVTYQKAHFAESTFFTDRHYHKNYRLRNQNQDQYHPRNQDPRNQRDQNQYHPRNKHKQISQYAYDEVHPEPDLNDEMNALLIEMPPPSPPPKTSNTETFITAYY